jgi:uncharacterized protein (DUF1800 family)
MVNSDTQLREKMALFWHGHFASRNVNIFYQQLLLDTIPRGALGNFGDLLKGVSKASMMMDKRLSWARRGVLMAMMC